MISDANRGLGVFVRGTGDVENLIFSDIMLRTRLLTGHWWGKAEPIHVSAVLWAPGVDEAGADPQRDLRAPPRGGRARDDALGHRRTA